jgi:hypothetical protein
MAHHVTGDFHLSGLLHIACDELIIKSSKDEPGAPQFHNIMCESIPTAIMPPNANPREFDFSKKYFVNSPNGGRLLENVENHCRIPHREGAPNSFLKLLR